MYFVTTKRAGYVLFCMTPSERAAIGLTENNLVHLLMRASRDKEWTVAREWLSANFSHTEFMVSLGGVDEPADANELLAYLPAKLQT